MKIFRPHFALAAALSLVLSACGGGNSSTNNQSSSSDKASARWSTATLDLGGASVGSTTVIAVNVTNDGTGVGDFSNFDNLPAGVTAQGCSTVGAGATCSVSFTWKPTTIGQASAPVGVTGVAAGNSLQLTAKGLDTSMAATAQAITMVANGLTTSWTGSLNFVDINKLPYVLEDARVVTAADYSESCSVTVQGSHQTDMAGYHLEIGTVEFTIPAQGTVAAVNGVTATTFAQPLFGSQCYLVNRPDVGYDAVEMFY